MNEWINVSALIIGRRCVVCEKGDFIKVAILTTITP